VWFYYGEYWKKDWKGIAGFVFGYLGPELAREVGDVFRVCLKVTVLYIAAPIRDEIVGFVTINLIYKKTRYIKIKLSSLKYKSTVR
jgi:hypothetical protein